MPSILSTAQNRKGGAFIEENNDNWGCCVCVAVTVCKSGTGFP